MIKIIPAIDLIDGKCVRLTEGDFSTKKEYGADPLEMARRFEAAGITRLHLVDLDGARSGSIQQHKILERIATHTALAIDFGGGLRSDEDLKIAFESGANQVTGGSVAVNNPEIFSRWISAHGGEKIILGADARNGRIATSGWEKSSGPELLEFIGKWIKKGIQYCISTDVAKDGRLQGPSFGMYEQIQQNHADLKLIASGGVSTMQDILDLNTAGIHGVIVGKAIYEGRIQLSEINTLISN